MRFRQKLLFFYFILLQYIFECSFKLDVDVDIRFEGLQNY